MGAIAARQNAAGVSVSPSCSPLAGRSRHQSPVRSPESGASSAIRAETMFDKTRLPYVALDVLCVLLGTYAPPARGACAREPGVGCIGGVRACVRWEVTRRESRTGVGGCVPDARALPGWTLGAASAAGGPRFAARIPAWPLLSVCLSVARRCAEPTLLGCCSRLCAPSLALLSSVSSFTPSREDGLLPSLL